jgi:predicted class III extradiol MEMO1 family dioxygenase
MCVCVCTRACVCVHVCVCALWAGVEQEIEGLRPDGFAAYLARTRNTICGRHPIGVLLHAVAHLRSVCLHTYTHTHTHTHTHTFFARA